MRREPLAWTLLGVLPVLLVVAFTFGARHHQPAYDFRAVWQASRDVAHGRNPYPTVASIPSDPAAEHDFFIYPAAVAVVMVPFGLMPFGVAAGVFMALLVASVAATLRVLGVRDWRCYGAAFAAIPVLESFRLGALSPLLALGLAVAWTVRDRRWALPAVVCAVVVAKLFLWPVFVWLLATRRWGAAARAAGLTVVVGAVGWAVVGFGTLNSYPALLGKMTDVQFRNTIGVDGLLASLGAGTASAHNGSILVALAGTAAIVAAARWGRAPELAFGVAILVALLASPITWLHYETLLLVPVALGSRTLSGRWLLPLVLWVTPQPQSWGSPWRIALPMAVAAAIVLGRPMVEGLIRWNPLRGVAQPG
ncbi:MAG: glycosyltransferase family 87 protein [Gaiellaceae bacterium]